MTAPIRTVTVAWGKIGYRELGRGRPLVLVSGYSDSIDEWAPRFIDALARHHRVFALDNEGVGHTTLRPGTLTISRMGDDTAAFIAALHLQRPDVLGSSMGGETVQALAVRHPGSVRRIILCSTAPGDGSALPPNLRSGAPPYSNFFPTDQNGCEPAGHRLSTVRAPALIAQGAEDPDPVANSRTLFAELPNARLHIYPDAAHGFWFQDAADFVARIDRFVR